MALSMNSEGIPGGFRGNAGFSGKFGVWGGFARFGVQKAFAQIATTQIRNAHLNKEELQKHWGAAPSCRLLPSACGRTPTALIPNGPSEQGLQ